MTAPSVELVVDADELGWQGRDTDQFMEGPAFRERQIALLLQGTVGGGRRPLDPVALEGAHPPAERAHGRGQERLRPGAGDPAGWPGAHDGAGGQR
ncbi:hypothetical protein GXW82_43610 [Streptacidiphilus sp. 4-A2]|nr:hypothetical protein [Streptacidiphilus sp. 4-A2]